MFSTLHPLDLAVLAAYFLVVTFLGVVVGKRQTRNLRDFFTAGGKWGSPVAFIYVFASAVGGAEAVVVGGAAYRSGLSGVWLWFAGGLGLIIYYIFAPIYKRVRVFNLAEVFEMRFGPGVATCIAIMGSVFSLFLIGTFALAVAKTIAGLSGWSVEITLLVACLVVALYVGSGGLMSSLLTDLFQGVLSLTVFCFLLLPFLWGEVGGFQGLVNVAPERWSLFSEEIPLFYVLALILGGLGAVATPVLFSFMVVGRDERVATQCAWSHIWKRIMTVLFAVYGIMFAIYKPGLHTQPIPQDTELVWGIVMKEIVPAGLLGLLVASFFAALMSTVDTMATASSAMTVDYLFKKRWFPGRSQQFYLRWARVGGVVAVLLAYLITLQFSTLKEIIEFLAPLQGFLGIPLFFGIAWRGANRRGVWASLMVGVSLLWMVQLFHDGPPSTKVPLSVFPPIGAAALTMYLVSRLTRPESETLLHRFYCILNTPLGRDERLSAVGIRLPAMAGSEGGVKIDERLDEAALARLYQSYATQKIYGRESSIELVREPGLEWYYRGLLWFTLCCALMVSLVWAGSALMVFLSSQAGG